MQTLYWAAAAQNWYQNIRTPSIYLFVGIGLNTVYTGSARLRVLQVQSIFLEQLTVQSPAPLPVTPVRLDTCSLDE